MSVTELNYQPAPPEEGAQPLPPDFLHYNHNAEQVLASLRPHPDQEHIKLEDLQAAYQKHIQEQTDPCLREQAHLLIFAVAARQWQREKDNSPDKALKSDRTGRLLNYNHALSQFIYDNPGGVFKEDLEGWLGRASGDDFWAASIINGAAGEVAVHRLLQETPGVMSVHAGTIEQDRKGVDLVARIKSPEGTEVDYGIDVKVRRPIHDDFDSLERIGRSGWTVNYCG
jgi:hypothetical protein